MQFLFHALLPLLFTSTLAPASAPPYSTVSSHLAGVWEGSLILGVTDGTELPMQLYLTVKGRQVTGRSYILLPNGETLQMDLSGRTFRDGSFGLTETRFAGDPENGVLPQFNRQYQIVYRTGLWGEALKGYWQEVTEDVLDPARRMGRVELRRRKREGV